MAAIGTAWVDGAWIFEGWAAGAWSDSELPPEVPAQGGGGSMTRRQMRALERKLLLEMIRGDDELVALLLSQSLTRR